MHATEEFESGETRPVTVAVLPAQVNLIRQRMLRREAQVEEAGELEAHLSRAVAGELGVKAYEVELITAERINADPELQALVVEANRRFDEVLGNITRRLRKQIENRNFPDWSMGFRSVNASDLESIPGFSSLSEESFQSSAFANMPATSILDMMKTFYNATD